MLQLADLPRSTFYDHRRRLNRSDTRAGIKEAIRAAFEEAKSTYGHRRVRAVLLRQGWTVSKKTVLKLMRELGLQCPGEKPLVHSDQGFQYRHSLWQDTLAKAGLTQSMSRKGTCLDNAVMEGFFSHLKEEWFRIQKPETVDEFHTGLNDYLSWWNTTRIQQRLGYLSPDEYRAHTTAIAWSSIILSNIRGPLHCSGSTSGSTAT